jgi:DNA-directed RNA polymerase subunit RPC12/RpoP
MVSTTTKDFWRCIRCGSGNLEEWELKEGDVRIIYVCLECGYPFKNLDEMNRHEKEICLRKSKIGGGGVII